MKLSKTISLLTLFFLLVTNFSFGQGVLPPGSSQPPEIPVSLFSCSPNDTLRICMLRIFDDVLKVILVIALIFAALMIALAGVSYIIKGGKFGEKDIHAKDRILYAAVGLVIAFLAWVMTAILQRIISNTGQNI